ncbi:MAG: phosphoglycerate kinase [Patescibacteria group bacterium]
MSKITYIDEVEIVNKRVLLRVDFNVSLNPNASIADDARIRQSLPTIQHLLKNGNTLILISHLGRPKGIDKKYSLKPVAERLQTYIQGYRVELVEDIDNPSFDRDKTIYILENIRFFPKEKDFSTLFAKKLSSFAEVYVNDAFGVCHRSDTSVVGPPKFLPSYGGLLLKKEVEMIKEISKNPKKPVVAIIGGAKVSTKVGVLNSLIKLADYVLIGGGLANTFINAQGQEVGLSFCEYEAVQNARNILALSKGGRAVIELPVDAIVADQYKRGNETLKIDEIPQDKQILDIGPETQACFGNHIANAATIIWNGPVGYFEDPLFRNGTDFIYYAITQNNKATSVVGGGDTLAAISKKEYLDKITHISTGGGAMLEFIEKGSLPGIDALKK